MEDEAWSQNKVVRVCKRKLKSSKPGLATEFTYNHLGDGSSRWFVSLIDSSEPQVVHCSLVLRGTFPNSPFGVLPATLILGYVSWARLSNSPIMAREMWRHEKRITQVISLLPH